MNKRKFLILILLTVWCVNPSIAQKSSRQSEAIQTEILQRAVTGKTPTGLSVVGKFSTALSEAHAPGGVVNISGCPGDSVTLFVGINTATVRDVLDAIIIADPQYNWQIDKGVINLVPKNSLPALLKTRISRFEVKDATNISYPLGLLQSLPEVQEQITKLKLKQALQVLVSPGALEPQKNRYNISCENVTLQEALNAIVRAQGSAVWEYKEIRCGEKVEYSIHFIVE